MNSNSWNEIKASGMVLDCLKAATQHHSQYKIALLWCYNDGLGHGNNSWDKQIKDKSVCIY